MKRREFLAGMTSMGLTAAAGVSPTKLLGADAQGAVSGRITGDGEPLAGVLVSDGCRVVRTDAAGGYVLPTGPDSGRFVFVTTPRGYWTERFFVPLEVALRTQRADFDLKEWSQPDRFDFVFLADTHLEPQHGIGKFQASIREINGLKPQPAFLLVQGDLCLQAGVGEQYLESLALADMPSRTAPGNHEMLMDRERPQEAYEQLLGPLYYSFDWGGVHFIILDGNKCIPGDQGWKTVHGCVEGSEMTWLKADLAAQPREKPIIVGIHIPVVSTFSKRQGMKRNSPQWQVTNDKEVTDLLSQYQVKLVLQGHMHENERITVGGVEYVESISACGAWWRGREGFERGVDGSPRGYRVVSIDGTRISHRYQSSCESRVDRQGEFVGLPETMARNKTAEFVFNCYDAPQGATAKGRFDQGPWQTMPEHAATHAPTGLRMPHHFRLAADLSTLAPGRHAVEVHVTWLDGTLVNEKETIVVE